MYQTALDLGTPQNHRITESQKITTLAEWTRITENHKSQRYAFVRGLKQRNKERKRARARIHRPLRENSDVTSKYWVRNERVCILKWSTPGPFYALCQNAWASKFAKHKDNLQVLKFSRVLWVPVSIGLVHIQLSDSSMEVFTPTDHSELLKVVVT